MISLFKQIGVSCYSGLQKINKSAIKFLVFFVIYFVGHNLGYSQINRYGNLVFWGATNTSGRYGTLFSGSAAGTTGNLGKNYYSDTAVSELYAGRYFGIVKLANNKWYCFGRNSTNDLAPCSAQIAARPNTGAWVQFHDSWSMVKVSTSEVNTAIIREDGTLWVWGQNGFGQLGTGNTNTSTVPIKIGGSSQWTEVAVSLRSGYAVKSNGELWSWGSNTSGLLGIGNTTAGYYGLQKVDVSNIDSNYKGWKCISTDGNARCVVAITTNGRMFAWGNNSGYQVGLPTSTTYSKPTQVGSDSDWVSVFTWDGSTWAIKSDSSLWAVGRNSYGQLGIGGLSSASVFTKINSTNKWVSFISGGTNSDINIACFAINHKGELFGWGRNYYTKTVSSTATTPSQIGTATDWLCLAGFNDHFFATRKYAKKWSGTGNYSDSSKWAQSIRPIAEDSIQVVSGTLTIDQEATISSLLLNNSSTVVLSKNLTTNGLHLQNGTVNLNGQRLTVTGSVISSTVSSNYRIQAGTSASPKPRSELIIKPTTAVSSTLYFDADANRLAKLELGDGAAASTFTLGSSVKIKGGEDGGTGPGLLRVNYKSKVVVPADVTLTLESDSFNAGLYLGSPSQRSLVCTGTGKVVVERDHYGLRGWRLYSHPYRTDIDLQQVADDIDIPGAGGTAEGFYSNSNTSLNAAWWYDYSKADTTQTSDPAWTAFTSAKGSIISGNANKWKKHTPLLLFNPGAVKGSGAFDNPNSATYQAGKIQLSYTLDSTAVYLNDGTTQTISTGTLPSTSNYFFITNPFTTPIKLCRIQGLNSTTVDPYFYYWKQRRNTVTDNFAPAEWQAEKIFTGSALRDSNISIPAFGVILVRLKNSGSTTFTIPESAKQISNFNYIIGGAKSVSGTGQMFVDVNGNDLGANSIELKLLVNDSLESDRVLIYDETGASSQYTTADAKKFVNTDFPNVFALTADQKPVALNLQDISSEINSGKSEVAISLGVQRDDAKKYPSLYLQLSANNTDLEISLRDKLTQKETLLQTSGKQGLIFSSNDSYIQRYELVLRRSTASTKDVVQENSATGNVVIVPNPSTDFIQIKASNGSWYQGEVQICDLSGRILLVETQGKENPISIANLQPGMYVVKTAVGSVMVRKN